MIDHVVSPGSHPPEGTAPSCCRAPCRSNGKAMAPRSLRFSRRYASPPRNIPTPQSVIVARTLRLSFIPSKVICTEMRRSFLLFSFCFYTASLEMPNIAKPSSR
jgi:hypothetical protein